MGRRAQIPARLQPGRGHFPSFLAEINHGGGGGEMPGVASRVSEGKGVLRQQCLSPARSRGDPWDEARC